MLLFLKTMHNLQWNHPRLLLAHRVLISLCTPCSKYDTILLLSPDCWTPHVSSNFKLKAVCSDLLPVIVKHSFVVVLRGVNVTQVVRHMYIKYLFSTRLNVYIVRGLSMWVLKKNHWKHTTCTAMGVNSCTRGVLLSKYVLSTYDCLCNLSSNLQEQLIGRKKNNFSSCPKVFVLNVACFVDVLSVYFAHRLCLKRERICIDLSVC